MENNIHETQRVYSIRDTNLGDDGNTYKLVYTTNGDATFEHIQTGQWLHAQVGPKKEAQDLYILPSELTTTLDAERVILDAGMGCAAQVMATLDAFESNSSLKRVKVFSFDLDNKGIVTLLKHLDQMEHLKIRKELLISFLNQSYACVKLKDRVWEWQWIAGDFVETLNQKKDLFTSSKVTDIYFDFFSPSVHPKLWHLSVFEGLFRVCDEKARLYTYCSATCVRAAMLAAGFYVGLGDASGTNKTTTIAARRFDDIKKPLTKTWLGTFMRSQKPFAPNETQGNAILERVNCHAQWNEERAAEVSGMSLRKLKKLSSPH